MEKHAQAVEQINKHRLLMLKLSSIFRLQINAFRSNLIDVPGKNDNIQLLKQRCFNQQLFNIIKHRA